MANGGDLDQLLATLKGDGVVGDNFGIGDLQAAARKVRSRSPSPQPSLPLSRFQHARLVHAKRKQMCPYRFPGGGP